MAKKLIKDLKKGEIPVIRIEDIAKIEVISRDLIDMLKMTEDIAGRATLTFKQPFNSAFVKIANDLAQVRLKILKVWSISQNLLDDKKH